LRPSFLTGLSCDRWKGNRLRSRGSGILDKFGLRILAQTGGQQGTSTAFAIIPARNAGVVVLCKSG